MAAMDYELLDFGAGRKLERFGPYILDRPSPAAIEASPRSPRQWNAAIGRYERPVGQGGAWRLRQTIDDRWFLNCSSFNLELKLTEAGHLGVFPEQADNWRWIAEQAARVDRPKILNLFAYTGASTLAAAAAGAEVVHVDAAASVVQWARRNAAASGLSAAPIRWIVEDALKFAERELRRGNRYDAVLLDPPAYGHGPKGQPWKLDDALPCLLEVCFELCAAGRFMLLSCHSGELAQAATLRDYAEDIRPREGKPWRVASIAMNLISSQGAGLNCGAAVRWIRSKDILKVSE